MNRIRYVVYYQTWADEPPSAEFHATLGAARAQLRAMRDAGLDAWLEDYNPSLRYP